MWEFNLVVTMASGGRFRQLLADLEPLGEFHKTEFLGVILGRVADPETFLETVRKERERGLIAFQDLGRVIPVERTFVFRNDEFLEKLCEAVRPWIEMLADQSFYVRLERRGLKGRIVSPEVERAVDDYIERELAGMGSTCRIDFNRPDAVLAAETVGERCGVGLLTRERMSRYPFVRVS